MYTIEPNAETLHGYFSREREPLLTIKSGEMLRYSCLDAAWNYYNEDLKDWVESPLKANDPLKGHAMCGPIAIEGAKKGRMLEVQIGNIVPEKRGWNRGGGASGWELWERLGVTHEPPHKVLWDIDTDAGTAKNHLGHTVKIAPFMGVMGMPPDEAGNHSTPPPRIWGGNIDCKLLTSGTSLFLPIPVDGGLFSVGDGHAAQGDGELSGTAIECPIKQLDLTFVVHEEMALTVPRARIHGGWMTLGFNEDLDEAMYQAANAMLDFMMEDFNISRKDALSLASVVVDLHITQVVNGVKGVQAILMDDAIVTA
jgi:acetamidase/formamidase